MAPKESFNVDLSSPSVPSDSQGSIKLWNRSPADGVTEQKRQTFQQSQPIQILIQRMIEVLSAGQSGPAPDDQERVFHHIWSLPAANTPLSCVRT